MSPRADRDSQTGQPGTDEGQDDRQDDLQEGQWVEVVSTCVHAVTWARGMLSIRMRTGRVLTYLAPRSQWRAMLQSPSKGRYLGLIKEHFRYLG
jgi:hypothetical protein